MQSIEIQAVVTPGTARLRKEATLRFDSREKVYTTARAALLDLFAEWPAVPGKICALVEGKEIASFRPGEFFARLVERAKAIGDTEALEELRITQ